MKRTVIVNSETMGSGSEELGRQIMSSFLRQLFSVGSKPDVIVFYNSAVKLLTEESPVSDAVDALFRVGVDIVACGTCVGHYGLNDKIVVGRVSNMQEIVSLLLESQSVMTI